MKLQKYLFDFLLFFTIGIIFLTALNFFKGEKLIEFIIFFIFISFYIIFGIYHHAIKDQLRLKIVIEYILLGFLTLFLIKLLVLP